MVSKPGSAGSRKKKNQVSGHPPFTWNDHFLLARQGDSRAVREICMAARPLTEQLCRTSFFADVLGKDETRSTASLALLEFVRSGAAVPEDPQVPRLLTAVLRNALLNSIRKQQLRSRYEQPVTLRNPEESVSADAPENAIESLPADAREEPEATCLQAEQSGEIREALRHLTPNEREVIRRLFFKQQSVKTVAQEMRFSDRNVRTLRRNALQRLKHMLERSLSV